MQFLIASTGARGTKTLWVEARADVIKVLSERIVQALVPPSARAARAAASAAAARPPEVASPTSARISEARSHSRLTARLGW